MRSIAVPSNPASFRRCRTVVILIPRRERRSVSRTGQTERIRAMGFGPEMHSGCTARRRRITPGPAEPQQRRASCPPKREDHHESISDHCVELHAGWISLHRRRRRRGDPQDRLDRSAVGLGNVRRHGHHARHGARNRPHQCRRRCPRPQARAGAPGFRRQARAGDHGRAGADRPRERLRPHRQVRFELRQGPESGHSRGRRADDAVDRRGDRQHRVRAQIPTSCSGPPAPITSSRSSWWTSR